MDPQACLDRAYDALHGPDADPVEFAAALADYWRWRSRGGFEPAGGDDLAHAMRDDSDLRGLSFGPDRRPRYRNA